MALKGEPLKFASEVKTTGFCSILRLDSHTLGILELSERYLSNEKTPDDTTQLCGGYNKPLQGSLLTNQYNGK